IGFAGDAFLLCPLSSDYGGVLLSLEDLKPASIPRGGTNLGAAIEEAVRVFANRRSAYKTLVVLTDGENLEGDPAAVAQKAKDQGVKIYAVGIGTQEGELIQVVDGQGKAEFLKDSEGNFVKSRLNEALLQEIALATGGLYVRSGGSQSGLDIIYDRALSKLDKTEFDSEMKRRYFERFQWPLGLAFLLLFIETILAVRKRENG
ncbi:MAG TPA: VWA domain-containing protein, partial [Candidatus Bathyarchaeia archaeon]|nr:VWA domain-containing protein [Candidatus Bathyarchaeia archaeon]